jgi:hypothetical protein
VQDAVAGSVAVTTGVMERLKKLCYILEILKPFKVARFYVLTFGYHKLHYGQPKVARKFKIGNLQKIF